MVSAVKNCFTTKLGRLIDNYIDDGIQRGELIDGSNKIMTTSIENIYLRSPDMQMLLNLLAEKEGMWSAILILSIFDVDFKNEFKVIHFAVYSNLESEKLFLGLSRKDDYMQYHCFGRSETPTSHRTNPIEGVLAKMLPLLGMSR